ncbi:MAG: peptidase M14 [Burkholderiales bacterium]|nr:peptidase M14 [Burkholderiales bacterium]
MTTSTIATHATPFERGNQNQTTDWATCIAYYETLARDFPAVLRFFTVGTTDTGHALHAGVVSFDGVFDRDAIHAAGRPVFFNNNGIHPGEPEGIDACMALVRDFCTQPARLAALGSTVFLFIPVYNVDGCLNRQATSRVNQLGPEQFGFRANGRNLDLNRDFIKCDSLAAQAFNRFFTAWDPDVMVDTHTSNGADYPYTMTLINTQSDELGGDLGDFLRETMLPALYADMEERGWPTCPYVNPVQVTPDDGIEDFLEVPRFSTGYAALHHTIGFMPETHMLKPFADRYAAMRALVESALAFTVAHAPTIQGLRRAARAQAGTRGHWPVSWKPDYSRPDHFRFKGYAAVYRPSVLGDYQRLAYDRSQPWERDIPWFNRCVADVEVPAPRSYYIPQAWREVIERLQWNGVQLERLDADRTLLGQAYRIDHAAPRLGSYEGHMFHDEVQISLHDVTVQARAGDVLVHLDQPRARYAVETLEPQAHDSFFRWGFFNAILEKKEHFSDYVFEDTAAEMLRDEPALAAAFAQWKLESPQLLSDQQAVLSFLYANGQRHAEPEWRQYPVVRVG